MAVKPIVNKINTFDPALSYVFSFSFSGNQSRSNRLVITDNDTNQIVYDNTVTTMRLEQILPAGTLSANKQYSAQFQSIDSNNEISPISDKAYFYCVSTPIFQFTNAISTIENSAYEFIVEYKQSDGESLKEYEFTLYSEDTGEVVVSSGLLYASSGATSISYNFTSLENNKIYSIQVTGATVNGLSISTNKFQFRVEYIRPSQYSTFYAENDPLNGVIRYNTNICIIEYNGEAVFDYDNGNIMLYDKPIYYDEGFLIEDNFCIKIKGNHFVQGEEIFYAKNQNNTITLHCIYNENGKIRFVLNATNLINSYVLISKPEILDDDDLITIVIVKKGNLYGIKTYVDEDALSDIDIYYGNTSPIDVADYSIYIYDDSMETVSTNLKLIKTTYSSTEPTNPNDLDRWFYEED